ncbi:hypothetical protein [Halocatena pleomorpha]|uniref:Uncharacterized protein n=1 Tax=Halocatena pleomorpha TaxID=1785090 RepID=A0A3P3RDA2_9EURY|nr:hypothetical protein [Halocatena pleomorpha]RRJ31401.1 hypothetical protein EIK79_06685 [Halocatena pleomorpha]
MDNNPQTTTPDVSATDDQTSKASDQNEYDLPVELFAGSVIFIMGVLVLVTPLITEMPADTPWDPVLINGISGGIYVLTGVYFIRRAGDAR